MPCCAHTPSAMPSSTPGFCAGSSFAHAATIGCVRSMKPSMSMPAAAAGPSPKLESAEKRPPMLGTPGRMAAKCSRLALVSKALPGSVIAMKRAPASLSPSRSRSFARK
ncbi:hypothetical protein D3C83_27110 [compost metagenome]